jgi:MFS family permease
MGLASFEMLAMFRRGLFYAYLSIYLRHYLGLSVTETTLFATFPMMLNVLAQTFVWGRLSDHFQMRRSLMIIGELSAAVGTVLVWYIHRRFTDPVASGYAIIIGLTLIEIFWSMSNISWSALVSDIYCEHQRSRIQGRLSSLGGVGRMAGVWIGGLLYDGMGHFFKGWGFYEGTLFFVAAGVMLCSVFPLFFLPEGGVQAETTRSPTSASQPVPQNNKTIYLVFLIAMVFIHFGRNSIAIIFTQYLALDSGLAFSSQVLSYIVNTASLAIVIFGWMSGWICSRIGNGTTLLAGTLVAILALLLLAYSTNVTIIYVSSFLRGVGDAVIMTSSYTLASIWIPPRKRGRWFAWFNGTFFLSFGLAGTLIAGPIVDALIGGGYSPSWAYQMSFAAGAGMTAIGLIILSVLLLGLKKSAQKKIAEERVRAI